MVNLSQLLARIGWSQKKLANHIEVSEETVSRWMKGKRKTPKTVILYLELLTRNMNV